MEEILKTCTCCKLPLPLTSFTSRINAADKKNPVCKICINKKRLLKKYKGVIPENIIIRTRERNGHNNGRDKLNYRSKFGEFKLNISAITPMSQTIALEVTFMEWHNTTREQRLFVTAYEKRLKTEILNWFGSDKFADPREFIILPLLPEPQREAVKKQVSRMNASIELYCYFIEPVALEAVQEEFRMILETVISDTFVQTNDSK